MLAPPLTCFVDDNDDYRVIFQLLFKRTFPTYPVQFFAVLPAVLLIFGRSYPKVWRNQSLVDK